MLASVVDLFNYCCDMVEKDIDEEVMGAIVLDVDYDLGAQFVRTFNLMLNYR